MTLGQVLRQTRRGVALFPQRLRGLCRLDAFLNPPGGFVACVVQFLVMHGAERHGEFVGDLATHGIGLGDGQREPGFRASW